MILFTYFISDFFFFLSGTSCYQKLTLESRSIAQSVHATEALGPVSSTKNLSKYYSEDQGYSVICHMAIVPSIYVTHNSFSGYSIYFKVYSIICI